jgi:hydroxymethylpyrimidine pyrophosphatase-like HAD family hydrolase
VPDQILFRSDDPALNALRPPDGERPDDKLPSFFIEPEARFYGRYPWCLNPFVSVERAIGLLRLEVSQLEESQGQSRPEEGWQADEMRANVFLLSCALADTADDVLSGKNHDLSRLKRQLRPLRRAIALPETLLNTKERYALARLGDLSSWRKQWEETLHELLRIYARPGKLDVPSYTAAARTLVKALDRDFPADFTQRKVKNPRAFRSQDFTFGDVLRLAERFCAEFTDRRRAYLLVGLRTAGSYFAPILRAHMANLGFEDVRVLTLRPKGGVNPRDLEILRRCSHRGGLAVIVDEPVYQGITLSICIRELRSAGFGPDATAAVFPVHPAARDWEQTNAGIALHGCRVITIEPEDTEKYARLQNKSVEEALRPYFVARGWTDLTIGEDARSRELNQRLAAESNDNFHTRLKRVFAARGRDSSGQESTRYVLAKSVGHGWMAYQAFFAARALAKFVPPVLGLRDGILYSEWVGTGRLNLEACDRSMAIQSIAQYVAARVKALGFQEDPSPALCRAGLQMGMDILEKQLGRAYGSGLLSRLRRRDIRRELALLSSPFSALLDGNMSQSEWVDTGSGILKTDFEDHGMGRMALSVTDPAYDLSESILSFRLSPDEERSLLEQYSGHTGDSTIAERLPLYKLLACANQMASSLMCLADARLTTRHAELNRSYIDAWTFAMTQMARTCGAFVPRPAPPSQPRRIVFSDVDGVIDRYVFDFPTTTRSGIRALALLGAHGIPVYLNTARSGHDVREYCAAYGIAGGVAESGSYLWDATTGRELVLVSDEALAELDRMRQALERIPGVFTNHFYRCSIKAFMYGEKGTVPLPTALVQKVLRDAGAGGLTFDSTPIDTAITVKGVDKGTGLRALLKLIGREDAESIAIGDTGPDLPMFRTATRSYAPAHTPVRSLAALLGCRVAGQPYQAGFLEIARDIVHPDGKSCGRCAEPDFSAKGQAGSQRARSLQAGSLIDLLSEVEKGRKEHLLGALRTRRPVTHRRLD